MELVSRSILTASCFTRFGTAASGPRCPPSEEDSQTGGRPHLGRFHEKRCGLWSHTCKRFVSPDRRSQVSTRVAQAAIGQPFPEKPGQRFCPSLPRVSARLAQGRPPARLPGQDLGEERSRLPPHPAVCRASRGPSSVRPRESRAHQEDREPGWVGRLPSTRRSSRRAFHGAHAEHHHVGQQRGDRQQDFRSLPGLDMLCVGTSSCEPRVERGRVAP